MTGTDWKSALAALGERCEGEEAKNKSYVIRKKRRGVVFSTNPDYDYSECEEDEPKKLLNHQQKLHLSMERSGRAGKTVTIVKTPIRFKKRSFMSFLNRTRILSALT